MVNEGWESGQGGGGRGGVAGSGEAVKEPSNC